MATGYADSNSVFTNGVTAVNLYPAPSSGTQQIVTKISAANPTGTGRAVTINIHDTVGPVDNPLQTKTVPANSSVEFDIPQKHVVGSTTKNLTATTESGVTQICITTSVAISTN